jgi:hypothetical protein
MWQVNENLQERKKALKELVSLRQHAINVSRLHGDCKDLRKEISSVESSLAVTGSTKTADDVQQELDELSAELWVSFSDDGCAVSLMNYWRRNTEKEKQNLQNDRERRNNILRAHETELHKLQLQETELRSKVREKEALQKSVEAMKQEVASLNTQSKVMIQCSPFIHELIAIRTWINKLQKARDLLTYLIESIRPPRPNSIPSSLKRNKRPRNLVEMPINSRVLTSTSNGECLASRKRSLMTES